MAKDDKQKLFDESMRLSGEAGKNYQQERSTQTGRGDVTWDRATENYNPAFQGYKDYASGGGLKPEDIDRMRNAWAGTGVGGAGGGGGFSAPRLGTSNYQNLHSAYGNAYRPDYGEADTGFRKLAGAGGGFDQGQLDQIYGNVGQLSEIGRTGGITDEDKANINRKSILEQEETGGYSAQDRALIRAKTAASAPAYFGALKDNMERQRSATGNLANAGAMDFKLARQGAQQQGADRIKGEIDLGDSIRAGRESAGQFLSGKNLELAGLRTGNQLAGARSAGDLGLDTQMGITANQAQGLKGLQESQTGLGQWGLGQAGGLDQFGLQKAGGLDNWDLTQAQMDMQAAAASAAASSSRGYQSARDQAEFEQWVTEYGNQQKQYGIGGLTDLYGTNLGASQNYSNMAVNTLNNKYGSQQGMLGIGTQNRGSTAMENMQTIGNVVGGIAGAATGMGGLAGLGGMFGGGGGQQAPAFGGSTGMQPNNYFGGQAPQTNFATGYNPYNPNMSAGGNMGYRFPTSSYASQPQGSMIRTGGW